MLSGILAVIAPKSKKPDMINNSYAKATTPDEIVAAAIVQSFVKNFDDWSLLGSLEPPSQYFKSDAERHASTLNNSKKKLAVAFVFEFKSAKERHYPIPKGCSVNESKLNERSFRIILDGWLKISKEVVKTRKAAADAVREMEENEKKWNIAEKLLGMKRNQFGALVPVKTAK